MTKEELSHKLQESGIEIKSIVTILPGYHIIYLHKKLAITVEEVTDFQYDTPFRGEQFSYLSFSLMDTHSYEDLCWPELNSALDGLSNDVEGESSAKELRENELEALLLAIKKMVS